MKFSKILCLVRGDETDTHVIEAAVDLLRPRRRKLFLVYVIRVPRTQRIDEYREADIATAEAVLDRAEAIAAIGDEDCETVIIQGRSAGAIVLREVIDRRVSAVVLSVGSATRFGGFSLEPDAQFLLSKSPSTVIAVRQPVDTWVDDSDSLSTIDSGVAAGRVG